VVNICQETILYKKLGLVIDSITLIFLTLLLVILFIKCPELSLMKFKLLCFNENYIRLVGMQGLSFGQSLFLFVTPELATNSS
jgi:hypothetical protein